MNRICNSVLTVILLTGTFFLGCARDRGQELYREALAQWEEGNFVRARSLLEKSVRRRAGHPENADAFNRLGLLLWETGDIDEAAKAFSESDRILPGQFEVLCNLGMALSAQNDPYGAEQAFREASLIRPDDLRPFAFAGITHVLNGNWNDALRNLRRALQSSPQDPRLNNAAALAELHTEGPDTALARLRAVAARHPDYAPAFFNIASAHLHYTQNKEEALRAFAQYLEKASPEDRFVQTARDQIQTLSGETRPASDADQPRGRAAAEVFLRRGAELQREGQPDRAVQQYLRAVEADSRYEQAFHRLGLVYYMQGNMEQAEKAFTRAVELNPAFSGARFNLALVHYRLGNIPRALQELEAVLEQQPGYQPARDLKNQLTQSGG